MDSNPPRPDTQHLSFADLTLDRAARRVYRGEKALEGLSDKSFQFLWVLAENAPGAVSRDQLLKDIWGAVHVNDEALNQRVRIIRKALGKAPDGQDYILAVHGTGYRLGSGTPAPLKPGRDPNLLKWGIGLILVFFGYLILSEAGVLHLIHKWIN